MSSSRRSATYRQIASEIATRLANTRVDIDPLSPWAEEVVVASGGLASAITRELLAAMPNGIAGLRIQTLETLARRIVNDAREFPRVASDGERRLAMRAAVRLVDDAMLESRGIASMLERSYRDVRDSGFTLASFERRIRGVERSLRNARRTKTIVRVWYEYERLIAKLGAIDAADLLDRAATLASKTKLPPQIVAGFYDMTGMQRRLIEAIAPSMEFIPAIDAEPPAPVIGEYDTRHMELESLCDEVRLLLYAGVAASSIGITARLIDPYDARLVNRFAAARGFATTFEEETPLIAHRIGRTLVRLMKLRELGFPRAEVLELIRDGLRVKTRIRVDEADAETRRARIAAGTSDELRLLRGGRQVIDDYIALVAELEALTEIPPVELLNRISTLFRVETEMDLAAADEVAAVAEIFRRAAAWNIRFDHAAVIDALEQRMLASRTTGTVFFGDVMKLRGRTFEHLFLARAQDDLFPQRRTADPLIPDGDRRALGLREIGTGREEEKLLFSIAATAGEKVRASYAKSDGFGRVLRKSRFLQGSDLVILSREDGEEPPDHAGGPSPSSRLRMTMRQLQLLARSGTNSIFDGYFTSPALKAHFAQQLAAVTPTHFEDFGECPQKFLFKRILGVVDIDDPERELQINHRDKGTLDHRILERFYRSLQREEIAEAAQDLPMLPRELVARLESLIDAAFDEIEEKVPPFNRTMRTIERGTTKRILRDFIARDFADLAERGMMPKHFEFRFGSKYAARGNADHPEPFIIDAAGTPIRVEGSIDRIDLGGGRLRVVDYKSGKATRHQKLGDKIDRGVRLQLALYAMAASRFLQHDDVAGAIKPLVAGIRPSSFEFELAEKRAGIEETLDLFAKAIANGEFPAFPNERDEDFNSCKYCPVNHSCRTKHEPEEKYAVTQHKDARTLLS